MKSTHVSKCAFAIALSFGLLISGQAHAETVLFGVARIGRNIDSTLYRIDTATGVATAIGSGIGFERVSGMDFDANTRMLYGTGERPDGSNKDVLFTLNTVTGVGTEVGPMQIETFPVSGITMSDISFRPSDRVLFGWTLPGFDRPNGFFGGLASIDISNGTATLIAYSTGILGDDGNGLAFLPSGELLLAGSSFPEGTNCTEGFGSTPDCDDVLHEIDTETAVASLRTTMDFPPAPEGVADDRDPRINAMNVDPETGKLFASVVYGFGGTASNFLGVLDPTTGTVTLIGPSVRGLDALAFGEKPAKAMPWLGLLLLDD